VLYVRAGEAWYSNLTKFPLIYSVPNFYLGGLEALFVGSKPTKAPRDDALVDTAASLVTTIYGCVRVLICSCVVCSCVANKAKGSGSNHLKTSAMQEDGVEI